VGEEIAVLDGSESAFYTMPDALYESMLELIDDLRLAQIVLERGMT
jgi:hypothetical protein